MITAKKSPLIEKLLVTTFIRRIKRQFGAVHLRGREHVPASGGKIPVILFGNHSSWWDAVLPMLLSNRVFMHDAYAMMEERQLSRYVFFRRVGCFSIRREHARDAISSIRYAADMLRKSDRALWMYPQGEIVSPHRRPLGFYSGVSRLLRDIGEAIAVPVAFRYEFIDDEWPEVFISCGRALRTRADESVRVAEMTRLLQCSLEHEMDMLHEDILARNFSTYKTVLRGRRSVNEKWDAIRRSVTGI